MIPTFIAATVLGVLAVVGSVNLASLWLRILLIVLGSIVGLIGILSLSLSVYGKYVGFNWHFTPEEN